MMMLLPPPKSPLYQQVHEKILPYMEPEELEGIQLLDPDFYQSEEFDPTQAIFITNFAPRQNLPRWMSESGVKHVVNLSREDYLEELKRAVRMIQRPESFFEEPIAFCASVEKLEGMEPLWQMPIRASKEKGDVLDNLREYLESLSGSRSIRDAVMSIADELFTNAVFSAPVNQNNERYLYTTQRDQPTELFFENAGILYLWANDRELILGCMDPFGSLVPERVLTRLVDIYEQGVDSAMQKKTSGGAGIGFRLIYEYCVNCVIGVWENQRTIISCSLPLGKSLRQWSSIPLNFHLVMKGGKQMGDFKVEKIQQEEAMTYQFFGRIDEDASFEGLDFSEDVSKWIFDMRGVTAINSCGVREWINWLGKRPAGAKLEFHQCPKSVVDQFNMVEGFIPPEAEVISFYVPYLCEKCDQLTHQLFEKGKDFDPGGSIEAKEEISCPHCQEPAEIDVLEDQYFAFNQKR